MDDAYIADLAAGVSGALGGKVGIAPRIFLKKLVTDILDRVDQFPDFDPREGTPVNDAAAVIPALPARAARLPPADILLTEPETLGDDVLET